MMTEVDPEQKDLLKRQVVGFMRYTWRMHRQHNLLSNSLLVLGLILGTAATIAGFSGQGFIAGVISAAVTLLIGFQKAFNFSEKADFYRIVHTEAKALRDHLTYKVSSAEQLDAAVDALKVLRDQTARKLPRGRSMEEAMNMDSPQQDEPRPRSRR
jgi:hypothetical protein